MPNKTINLQDVFLNQVRKENVGVIIHLTNGFQLRGNVKGFDNFTVILDSAGKPPGGAALPHPGGAAAPRLQPGGLGHIR